MPHVIGTAGHVDHGKSALVRALTGIDPDRLAEEKARGLTIDLGFAWTTLPSGREVGFVDVPGHERFVHNMLAGVGGIGCALFVVDAGEGWRPQSAEHLAILDLLGIPAGVVALTKVDLVDRATRDQVAGEVRDRLRGTTLAGAELVATAAPSGVGVAELAAALDRALDRLPEPPDRGRPRLPVDRVFTMRGSGTVVTGTLSGGSLRADGEAELLPAGRRARVRGLQGHGRPLGEATPARRVAVNQAGVATDEVARGDVLVLPGQWAATRVADVRLRCLAGAPGPLRPRGAYLVYAGTAETAARLQPLDAAEVPPGGDALVRLHLERPLVLDVFEPVVLRDSGRDETVGGGLVLDPFPPGVVRGTAARVRRAEELEAREAAGRAGLLERVLAERAVVPLADLPRLAAIAPRGLPATLAGLPTSGAALPPGAGAVGPPNGGAGVPAVVRSRTLAWARPAWEAAAAAVLAAVERHHRADPSAPGLPAQGARDLARAVVQDWTTSRDPASGPSLNDPTRALNDPAPGSAFSGPAPGSAPRRGNVAERGIERPRLSTAPPATAPPAAAGNEVLEALVAEGRLVVDGQAVRLPGHAERLDPAQRALVDRVERAAGAAGVGLLGETALAELGADRKATALLVRMGVLVSVAPGAYLGRSALERAVETLQRRFPDGRPFAATEAKEALGTTRRTAIPLLEHLDRTGVTVRQGDLRRLTGRPLRPPASGRR
jgi:selenocysteine-specific elongation factor